MKAKDRKEKQPPDKSLIQSILKAVDVLGIIGREQPVSLSTLTRKSGLKKSTVARLTKTLIQAGVIEQNSLDKMYSLGIWAVEMGSRVLNHLEVRRLSRPLIDHFIAKRRMSVLVSILQRSDIIFIDKVPAPETYRISMTVGDRAPAYCSASGKAMLAYLDEDTLLDILKEKPLKIITANTITDVGVLLEDLERTRQRGYALDLEERLVGIYSVAAPILSRDGMARAAISVPRMKTAITREELHEIGGELSTLCQRVRQLAGWEEGIAP